MQIAILAVLSVLILNCAAQRSPYAGGGYGVPTPEPSTPDPLANRFGDDDTPTTTMRLPIEALGDAEMVKRMLKLPEDKQPFWLLNWKALQANRNNPQTYEPRENVFLGSNRA